VARDLAAILRASRRSVALATRRKYFINGKDADLAKAQPHDALSSLLRDKRVQTLVSCASRRHVVEHGLGLDRCDVSAITGRDEGQSAESVIGQAIHVLARATRGMLVIGAGNTLAQEVLSTIDAERLILVASKSRDPAIAAHVAAGGAVVVKRHKQRQDHDRIVLRREDKALVSIRIPRGAVGSRRIARRRVESRMFAMALAFGMGISKTHIKKGLRSKK
jgi:hypothetical protein